MVDQDEDTIVEQIEGYFQSLSNWGRWGDDDRLGTLNLITPEVRAQAAATVRTGQAISLARDLDPEHPDPVHSGVTQVERDSQLREVSHLMGRTAKWDAVGEVITISPHGGNAHLDGLGHYHWNGKFYNGFSLENSTARTGSADLAVSDAHQGIITRGVLLDIAGLFGVPFVERGYAIQPEDLLAAERRQNVTVRSGDALLIHTGNGAALTEFGPLFHGDSRGPLDGVQAGLDITCLPFLRERDIAVMGADGTHDVQPSPISDFDYVRPIHATSLVSIGLWLMDNLDLTALAAACAQASRWEFLLTALPWRFVGATSSPLNPVAVF